ncbi:hypothetical protein [Paradevosia shaoguanensis]|uniref:Uncharacterized protein n=1 Tax=Paradevosia shaoguanensis TaxID=1335043 RepID=A0AA41QPS6_9HYPH|nr:hypothetical protein [Paradevosia shaoguanensis]KFL27494.1 hypothetical protein JP74_07920 [Devosia sp. 17-2-E-8]MCF1743281.1 hypothetical protein [Paradevosia shaoguanensis]MCI0127764.1 hypothetical protein [Paradevosia shaoguanensis]CDP51854.1 hypothetical protein [Devosia sp. DBB001]
MDGWPRIASKRFDGENVDIYRKRAAAIAEIITGFRMGRFDSETADEMEQRLMDLQNPILEHH